MDVLRYKEMKKNMRTYENASGFYRTVFQIKGSFIESHSGMFDSHQGGNLIPLKRRIIESEELRQMGCSSPEEFIIKALEKKSKMRELTGNYKKQVNAAYELNKELYRF